MSAWFGQTVLVVSPTPTAPLDYGNRRYILNSLRRLQSHGARVIFVHYPAEDDWRRAAPLDRLREMQGQWEATYVSPVSRPLHTDPAGTHHHLDEWWDEALGDLLRWIFSVHRIDVCLVNYAWLSKAFEICPPHVRKILVAIDRFAGRKELLAQNGVAPEYFYLTEDEERRAMLRCDLVWAIKEAEARYFTQLSGRPARVLPHVEQPELAYSCRVVAERLPRFGFMGACNSINHQNYRNFFDMLGPLVRRHLLPARFLLAGSLCDLFGPEEYPFLERLGRVDAVESFYRACDVVVVPMAFSTGLKIKVGEAIGYGKAVIAHAHAFEGYHPAHPFHALDGFGALCQAIVAIIDRPEGVFELERAALRTRDEAELRAELCVAAGAAPEGKRRFVVLAPADLLFLPQVVDHLCEACSLIGYIERPLCYVIGDATAVPAVVWARLGRHARVFAAPLADMALREDPKYEGVSFVAPAAFRAGGCQVLYAIRHDAAVASWLSGPDPAEDCVLRLEEWCAERDVRGDFELERSALSLRASRDAGVDLETTCLVGSVQAECRLRQLGVTLRHVSMALLRDGTESTVFLAMQRQMAARERRGVFLLVAGASPARIRTILRSTGFRNRWGRQTRTLVVTEAERLGLAGEGDLLAGFRLIAPAELVEAFGGTGPVPEVIAELGPDGAAFAWLREIAGRLALPYVALAGPDRLALANLTGATLPGPAGRAVRQLMRGLDALYAFGFAAAETRALRETLRFERDRGWSWLWRLVKHRVSV